MSFDTLGLSADILRAVAEKGYSEPTPIQCEAIPIILSGRDVLAGAQTGTGKTAGFTLPLLQRLMTAEAHGDTIRALILTPTRELAAQVADSVRTYGKFLPLRSTVVFGGVSINAQTEALRRGVNILVATPGRLLDHVGQKTLDLSQVEILVLDEADRMLDMGFIRDIRRILALLPQKRQNLLFSATFSREIKALADSLLSAPILIEAPRRNLETDLVTQVIHPVARDRKRELLSFLIDSQNWQQVLVFTRTKHGANRLSEQLKKDGIECAAIHGNKSQGARTRALSDFKQGSIRVLVATDIAARGLDIDQLPHVVNFEMPNVPEDYVHRVGRTGRAGNPGEALSLVCPEEIPFVKDIERLLAHAIVRVVIPGYEQDTPGKVPDNEARPAQPRNRGRRGGRSEARVRPERSATYGQPTELPQGTHHGRRGDGRRRVKSADGVRPVMSRAVAHPVGPPRYEAQPLAPQTEVEVDGNRHDYQSPHAQVGHNPSRRPGQRDRGRPVKGSGAGGTKSQGFGSRRPAEVPALFWGSRRNNQQK